MINWDRYPDFSAAEFSCKCGCGVVNVSEDLLKILQSIRDQIGTAMPISSGYRCPEHNSRVSGSGKDGPHTTGAAADISVSGERAFLVMKAALDLGVKRIGVQQKGYLHNRFIHIDLSEAHPGPTVWSY